MFATFYKLLAEQKLFFQYDHRIRAVVSYITHNLSTNLTIDVLANIACLSPTQLKKNFKSQTEQTLTEYITKLRMQKAQALLLHTDSPIAIVAELVGYTDVSAFSRRFSLVFRGSPLHTKTRLTSQQNRPICKVCHNQRSIIVSFTITFEMTVMLQIQSGLSAVLCVVVASIFWGTTGTASAFIPDVSPLGIGAFAMGVGGILLVLNAKKHLVSDKAKLLSQPKVLLIGSLCVAIYPLAFYSSMRLAGVAIGTVISIASAPFFTVMMERLISNKHITRRWKISFAFGVIGVILLTLGKTHYLDVTVASSNQVLGVLLGLIAGLDLRYLFMVSAPNDRKWGQCQISHGKHVWSVSHITVAVIAIYR